MLETYIALTIGPVIRTILTARYTRELWATSYLFSYLMKKIIGKLRKEGFSDQFLVPYIGDDKYFLPASEQTDADLKRGAGLFPDRFFIIKQKEDDLEKIKGIIDNEIKTLAESIQTAIDTNDDVHAFLKQYLHYYLIELTTDQNPVLGLSPYLDSAELQPNFALHDKKYLEEFLNNVSGSFLSKEAFGTAISFKTILEVATCEFSDQKEHKTMQEARNKKLEGKWNREKQREADKAEEELIDNISSHFRRDRDIKDSDNRIFKQAHKYIAIVHADGDDITKIIKNLKPEDFQGFSKKLKEFALLSVKKIDEYGGMNIYAGGDDLLFFAPVINSCSSLINPDNKTIDNIFGLCHELNKVFQSFFKGENFVPTQSFGVSISYYKFPLYEALSTSRELLFDKAKKAPKNQLAYRVLKHSGQYFGGVLNMKDNLYKNFSDIIEKNLEEADRILSSIMYKVQDNATLFSIIGKDDTKIKNFIDNSFNEPVHGLKEKAEYMDAVKSLIHSAFMEKSDAHEAIGEIYGALRTAAFLTGINI
jgi:CRISPR-associated protein Cmr2